VKELVQGFLAVARVLFMFVSAFLESLEAEYLSSIRPGYSWL
jgi:hypothetical protein